MRIGDRALDLRGIISALGVVIWELRNAPMGYESEDGFHIAYENSLLPQRWRAARGAERENPIPHKRRLAANRLVQYQTTTENRKVGNNRALRRPQRNDPL